MEVARDQLQAITAHLHSRAIKEQMREVYRILESFPWPHAIIAQLVHNPRFKTTPYTVNIVTDVPKRPQVIFVLWLYLNP